MCLSARCCWTFSKATTVFQVVPSQSCSDSNCGRNTHVFPRGNIDRHLKNKKPLIFYICGFGISELRHLIYAVTFFLSDRPAKPSISSARVPGTGTEAAALKIMLSIVLISSARAPAVAP